MASIRVDRGNPPRQYVKLINQVLTDEGWSAALISASSLKWSVRKRWRTSGMTWYETAAIRICAGSFAPEQTTRYVVLHEVAHLLAPQGAAHTKVFWKECFRLCERYGVDMNYAHMEGLRYKPRGAQAAGATYTNAKTSNPKGIYRRDNAEVSSTE